MNADTNDRMNRAIAAVNARVGQRTWDRLLSHLEALNQDIRKRGFAWWEPTQRYLLTGYDYGQYYDWDLYYEGIYASYNGVHDCYTANLEVFFSLQRPDGFIQRAFGSKPWGTEQHFKPFIAQIVLVSHAHTGDDAWLARYYPQLERFLEHWSTAYDGDGNGLCYWPGGADQSGMDNQSSRCGGHSGWSEGVDLNCYRVREYDAMAQLAMRLGRTADADAWRAKAITLRARINELLWDKAEGFYYDRDEQTGQPIRVKSVSCFTPLWARVASPEQAKRMITEHLVNPAEFWLTYPVASYARTEPDYAQVAACCNWRGCTWIPTNHMIVHALRHYGYQDLARDLAYKTLDLALANPVTREFYNAETGAGYGCNPFYGWSSLAYLLPFEVELGFDPTELKTGLRIPNLVAELGVAPIALPNTVDGCHLNPGGAMRLGIRVARDMQKISQK